MSINNVQIVCVYCNNNHKFSPYNVQINKQPITTLVPIIDNNFCVKTVNNEDMYKHYDNINKEFTKNDAIYWSDGITIFNILMRVLGKNFNKISIENISILVKLIQCNEWWDDLFEFIILNNESIINTQHWLDCCLIIFNKFTGISFTKYQCAIRLIHDRNKRKNESISVIKQSKFDKQVELIRLREQEELNKNIIIDDISYVDQFLLELKHVKKYDIKFLSSINTNQTTIAGLIADIGEISNLQHEINKISNERKIKIWEYYINQEEDKKHNIKYKKQKYEDHKKDILLLMDEHYYIQLTSSQKIQYKKIYEDMLLNKNNNANFVLDDWQKMAIDTISKGENCLIIGPTAGGKTYVMMKALDTIIYNKNDCIIYVSPTFHLAYQTYANIKLTFPMKKIMLVTSELFIDSNDATIYIGTAPELLSYFDNLNKRYSIGIFDEIHVMSKSFYSVTDANYKSDIYRSKCYAELLKKCDKQLIAASATINGETDLIKFIVDQINYCNNISVNDIKIIKYDKRNIPINEYRYVNNNIEPIKRDVSGSDMHQNNNFTEFTVENLFILLKNMKQKDMLPSIIFEFTDDTAWLTYHELINFISCNEDIEYRDYHKMIEYCNEQICEFNRDCVDDSKNEANIRAVKSKRIKLLNVLISNAKNILTKSINNYNKDNIKHNCEVTNIPAKYKQYNKGKLTQAHIDMIDIIQKLNDFNDDSSDYISELINNKGNYYRFSNCSCGIEQLKSMREPGSDESKWKYRKFMLLLAESQHIDTIDMNEILDIIMMGLEFGIAIINSSLPFVIQNVILQNIKTKNIGVVFASENMSMGINYPLRSVIIKNSKKLHDIVNPIKLIQMAGRCGRRNKDTEAHVIYWGIQNDFAAHNKYIKSINYSTDFDFTGICEINYDEVIIKLGNIFKTLYFQENEQPKQIIKSNDDDFIIEEKKKCEKRKEQVIMKRKQYLYPIILLLAEINGFAKNDAIELADMVCNIGDNIILDKYIEISFTKSRNINLLTNLLINIYNRYASSTYIEFIKYLENVVGILQRCEYRLIKLAKIAK